MVGGKCLYANRYVLATYSDYFHRMFGFTNQPQPNLIIIPICDYSYQIYHAYLNYIYTGTICDTDTLMNQTELEQFLIEMCELATVYEEKGLYEMCFGLLQPFISTESCVRLYQSSIKHGLPMVYEACVQIFFDNWKELYNREDFQFLRKNIQNNCIGFK